MFEYYNAEISVTQGNYINSILTLVFFASLCLIVTKVALFILKRHAYMEILHTKLIIIN